MHFSSALVALTALSSFASSALALPTANIAAAKSERAVKWVDVGDDFKLPGGARFRRRTSKAAGASSSTSSSIPSPSAEAEAELHKRAQTTLITSTVWATQVAKATSTVKGSTTKWSGTTVYATAYTTIYTTKVSTAYVTKTNYNTVYSTKTVSSTNVASVTAAAAAATTPAAAATHPAAAATTPATATTSAAYESSTGLVGTTYWNLKTTFLSLASFTNAMAISKFVWGGSTVQVVQGVPKAYWADGAPATNNGSAIQVYYPKGSMNPGNKPQGGIGFYSAPMDVTTANNLSLAYSVFFPKGFNFVKAGKLPGLYGGKTGCSGGDDADNCFSTRLMWRNNGAGELYLYAPRDYQTTETCTLGPVSYCNSVYGMSIGRGSWTFQTGVWTNIRQDIWLNTPGVADGGFNIWVNDKLVLTSKSVYYRGATAATKAVAGNVTYAESNGRTLIDYDSLPENITIPNGGFYTDPNTQVESSAVVATPLPTGTAAVDDTTGVFTAGGAGKNVVTTRIGTTRGKPTSVDFANRQRRARSFGQAPAPAATPASIAKRATADIPTGFLGIMFDTFFGGSSSTTYATPVDTYTWFNNVGLRIRS